MGDNEFKSSYPTIWHFLDTTLWPDVDGYNLFELLHRMMKRCPTDWTKRIVDEFQKLSWDDNFDAAYLAELFGRDVPPKYLILCANNAHELLWTLAEYLRFLYTEEKVRGREL